MAPQRHRDLPLLLSWEFEHDGARLIAVGNFWERGECFFRLTPRGLASAGRYVLREPSVRRVYAHRNGRIVLTASELNAGMLLHVGAMRYAFFVLEPYRESVDYGTVVRLQDMEDAMNDCTSSSSSR